MERPILELIEDNIITINDPDKLKGCIQYLIDYIRYLEQCDCGKFLLKGKCPICDNDE